MLETTLANISLRIFLLLATSISHQEPVNPARKQLMIARWVPMTIHLSVSITFTGAPVLTPACLLEEQSFIV